MIELIKRDDVENYNVYQSEYIVKNHESIVNDSFVTHEKFLRRYGHLKLSSTWAYHHYNVFSLSATSVHFYNIYKEFIDCLKDFLSYQETKYEYIWQESWLNYHSQNEVLNWHNHDFPYHGYLSIDPKNTTTLFENYEIENKIGQFYFGSGFKKHAVRVNERYEGKRITLAYDIYTEKNSDGDNSLFPVY